MKGNQHSLLTVRSLKRRVSIVMKSEYQKAMQERQEAVSRNASIRLRNRMNGTNEPLIAVPAKPAQPIGFEALEPDGTFIGFYRTADRAEVEDDLRAAGYLEFKLKQKSY